MEMKIVIDGNTISNEDEFHKILAKKLNFPDWYGRNLDALLDLITDGYGELEIEWVNADISRKKLSRYGKIITLFRELEDYYKKTKDRHNFVFKTDESRISDDSY
jgi:ribonuclease inhibitor